ncbi:hypothetical protein PAPYR_2769 [Paratrimastix pyriformis]|uniref:At4g15545-like C-terminal domain-containing protein n=1 Tax=Paratrimastix pyriformis TaxID=342808 RepID=A0ABQ8URG9_9EUKA|nr:hypothetical protein PAPYR_2769 [Paratrimastix pyriformis]
MTAERLSDEFRRFSLDYASKIKMLENDNDRLRMSLQQAQDALQRSEADKQKLSADLDEKQRLVTQMKREMQRLHSFKAAILNGIRASEDTPEGFQASIHSIRASDLARRSFLAQAEPAVQPFSMPDTGATDDLEGALFGKDGAFEESILPSRAAPANFTPGRTLPAGTFSPGKMAGTGGSKVATPFGAASATRPVCLPATVPKQTPLLATRVTPAAPISTPLAPIQPAQPPSGPASSRPATTPSSAAPAQAPAVQPAQPLSPCPSHMEGRDFFVAARQRLNYEQFNQFLGCIKALNNHQQDSDTTLQQAAQIFQQQHPDLFVAFRNLLAPQMDSTNGGAG